MTWLARCLTHAAVILHAPSCMCAFLQACCSINGTPQLLLCTTSRTAAAALLALARNASATLGGYKWHACLHACKKALCSYLCSVAGAAAAGRERAAVAAGAAAGTGTAPKLVVFISLPCGRCRCRGARARCSGCRDSRRRARCCRASTSPRAAPPRPPPPAARPPPQAPVRSFYPIGCMVVGPLPARVFFSPCRSSARATAGSAAGAQASALRGSRATGWRRGRWHPAIVGLTHATCVAAVCSPVARLCWCAQMAAPGAWCLHATQVVMVAPAALAAACAKH